MHSFQHKQKRRVFTKLIKDGDATMTTEHQARRFLEGFDTPDSKAELLGKLEDRRDHGLRRIREVLSFVCSVEGVTTLLIPLLKNLLTDETARPMYVPLRNRVLISIYMVPTLLETFIPLNVVRIMDAESAKYLALYLVAISSAFVEVRNSNTVIELAQELRDRGDVNETRTLCAVLLIGRDNEKIVVDEANRSEPKKKKVACWISDQVQPGGRHDNDHRNYRDIQLVPTANELRCEVRSWLPLASGENAFIQDPAIRILDNNFRLLREDAILSMKANIAEKRRIWKNARIFSLDTSSNKNRGLISFLVQCDSLAHGNPDWKHSRSLMHGTVVAFCQNDTPKMMGVITIRDHADSNSWLNASAGPVIGVAFHSDLDFHQALTDMQSNCSKNEIIHSILESGKQDQLDAYKNQLESYDMIEVSSSFFTYQPILKTLQTMTALPFLPELSGEAIEDNFTTPTYLPPVLLMPSDGFNSYECNMDTWSSSDIVSETSLDQSQADALRHAFSNRIALIQGPPGTGKTFIGALVARMIRLNTDETILCVCYTNHALDQFLEHMLEAGERRIVRIGGRSKSERLAPYQLRDLARQKSRSTSDDSRRIKQIDSKLHEVREAILDSMKAFKQENNWESPRGGIQQLLQDQEPDVYPCFVLPYLSNGFEIVGPDSKRLRKEILWTTWTKGEGFPIAYRAYLPDELPRRFDDIWSMPRRDRLALIEKWRKDILQIDTEFLHVSIREYAELSDERLLVQQQQDLQILKDARIIGATTTGAAQVKELLASTRPGVVIIEEAAEVLEAHVLAALQPEKTKHLIMIGDHLQLRPKVESYELSTACDGGYSLDCSLFERLVSSNRPSMVLEVQHRMRPEISYFIRKQTYPLLKDHPSVKTFRDVKGVSTNVAFIEHAFLEDGEDANSGDDAASMKTKSNYREAALCIEIVRFFLLQGYAPGRLVILTPYLGQLHTIFHLATSCLKEASACVGEKDRRDLNGIGEEEHIEQEEVEDERKGVRCSSIDNYQGEEADIVVASLVRSNSRGMIGFLKEEQRVNVLMSRARLGMFLVGSAATLRLSRQGQHVWIPILDNMQTKGQLVKGLPTYCQLHPEDAAIEITTVNDFRTMRPNGGCHRVCNYRMDCGHACRMNCHPFDRRHERVQNNCCEPCRRVAPKCPLSHSCRKLCKDECGRCTEPMDPILLSCGHSSNSVVCHDIRNEKSIESLTKRCKHVVRHTFADCGHVMDTTCSNANREEPVCPSKCGKIIGGCGHRCINACGKCDGEHSCCVTCDRKMFCGHTCGRGCHLGKDCPPCKLPCEVKCSHSSCAKWCCVPCSSCVEQCGWVCEHQGQCNLVCGAPCSRLPCNKRCQKKISCGHQCPSVCGEVCPTSSYCLQCCDDETKDHVVDVITLTAYKDHDVDADPIVVLPCKHFYGISTLDGHLGMKEVYKEGNTGEGSFVEVLPLSEANVTEKPVACPDCRGVIHSVQRYGRILRLSELRSLERKHLMVINQSLEHLSRWMSFPESSAKNLKGKALVKKLKEVMKTLLLSPMRKVSNACRDSDALGGIPRPPTRPLLHTYELLGRALTDMAVTRDDTNYSAAQQFLDRGIVLADETTSTRSASNLRLLKSQMLMKWPSSSDSIKDEATELVDWILGREELLSAEVVYRAKELKRILLNPLRDVSEVIKAMNVQDGYDYGGSWSSHWYECPNGHPYFIGECGGAMQESRCIECGAIVGGTSHHLIASNRAAGGVVAEVLQSEAR